MRRLVLLPLLLLACSRQTPDSLYSTADTLLKQGKLSEALVRADDGLRKEPSWRFRLLKADVLLAMSEGKKAMETLHSAEPPALPELHARFAMQEGYANFLLADYPAAVKSLDE